MIIDLTCDANNRIYILYKQSDDTLSCTYRGNGTSRICTIDKDNGLCLGCLRTINEISEWLYLDDKSKADILKKIKKRKIKKTDKFI